MTLISRAYQLSSILKSKDIYDGHIPGIIGWEVRDNRSVFFEGQVNGGGISLLTPF